MLSNICCGKCKRSDSYAEQTAFGEIMKILFQSFIYFDDFTEKLFWSVKCFCALLHFVSIVCTNSFLCKRLLYVF